MDFVHTSGGRTTAASERIRGNQPGNDLTWARLHQLSRRGIIADTGYGVAGRLTTDPALDAAWLDPSHLRARIADGVIAVTYANPGPNWEHRVARLQTMLPPAHHCLHAHAPTPLPSSDKGALSSASGGTRNTGRSPAIVASSDSRARVFARRSLPQPRTRHLPPHYNSTVRRSSRLGATAWGRGSAAAALAAAVSARAASARANASFAPSSLASAASGRFSTQRSPSSGSAHLLPSPSLPSYTSSARRRRSTIFYALDGAPEAELSEGGAGDGSAAMNLMTRHAP